MPLADGCVVEVTPVEAVDAAPNAENIEVHASHVGMGMNPLALYAIADRLAQDPQHWKRFDVKGARKWFYKVTHHSPLQAGSAL